MVRGHHSINLLKFHDKFASSACSTVFAIPWPGQRLFWCILAKPTPGGLAKRAGGHRSATGRDTKGMKCNDRRKSTRLQYQFPAMLMSHLGAGFPIEGAAINVSQRGAFIKTKRWESFRLQDRAVVTFFIPPDFSGQRRVIGLQGDAVITRVDGE